MRLLLLAFIVGVWPSLAVADDDLAPTWRDVGPILALRCANCHGAQGAAKGLRLDSYDGVLAGSVNGAVVLAGDTANSELLKRVRGERSPRMPFLAPPLPEAELELIRRWIEGGMLFGDRD